MAIRVTIFILFLSLQLRCFSQQSAHYGAAKYVPQNGERILILGQDLGAVGGLSTHMDGYIDNLNQIPAGVTTYTNIPSLGGLQNYTNWGSGDVNAQAYIDDSKFENTCLAIGLFINGELRNIRDGFWNHQIRILARWIKDTDRPVFLRIGYEFDGPWNGLNPDEYVDAWKQIVKVFDWEEVRNVAYVWQSAGINTNNIERWYPGDQFVNWVGYSHFDGPDHGRVMRAFAAEHGKPIMIAEAAPRRNLRTGDGPTEWRNWFEPLFNTIENNDQIKALAYINTNWDEQPMWRGQGWGDSRVEVNQYIKEQWLDQVNDERWLKSSDDLLEQLQYQFWQELAPLNVLNPFWEKVTVSVDQDYLTINVDNNQHFKTTLYDLRGAIVWESDSWNGAATSIPKSQLDRKILMLHIQADSHELTQKIFLKQ